MRWNLTSKGDSLTIWTLFLPSIGVQETIGIEHLWILEVPRVVHYEGEVGDEGGVFGESVIFDFEGSGSGVRQRHWSDVCDSLDFGYNGLNCAIFSNVFSPSRLITTYGKDKKNHAEYVEALDIHSGVNVLLDDLHSHLGDPRTRLS